MSPIQRLRLDTSAKENSTKLEIVFFPNSDIPEYRKEISKELSELGCHVCTLNESN